MKRIIALSLVLWGILMILCGCASDTTEENGFTTQQQTAAVETTAEPTETQVRWEEKQVYLCVSIKTKFFDGHSPNGSEYEYNEYGQKTKRWGIYDGERTGSYTEYEYDELGRLVKEYSHNEEYEVLCYYILYTYDENGKLVKETNYELNDEVSYETVYTYDDAGWLISEKLTRFNKDPDTTSEKVMEYNANHSEGARYYYEDGVKNPWYEVENYDSQGRITLFNRYNENGKWGSSREYFYDELGRISKEVYNTSSDMQADYNVYYTYDENGCLVKDLVDYYYGDETTYTYEVFDILVPVEE